MTMITEEQIPLFRLMTLLRGLRLEGQGIKVSKGRSCLTIVKKEFGWSGSRHKIIGLLLEEISRREKCLNQTT